MSDLQNMADLVSTGNQLLDDIRGGAISRMAHEHQAQQAEFKSEHDAKQAEFAQAHNAQMQQHDAAIASRRNAIDSALADATAPLVQIENFYDGTLHSKSSLLVADPNDEIRSMWVRVPTNNLGEMSLGSAGNLTKLHLRRMYSYQPGYPDFVEDNSRTMMQFVVAPTPSTSDAINAHILERQLDIENIGWWSGCTAIKEIHTIQIAGLPNYKSLFVRFVNVSGNELPAQNIEVFGGNAEFAIERVVNYPRILKA